MSIALQTQTTTDVFDKRSLGELIQFFFFLDGRINRVEFVSGLFTILLLIASTALVANLLHEQGLAIKLVGCFFSIQMIASFLSCIALAVKRMHDLNLSGKRLIIGVVLPLVLCVHFIMMCFWPGTPHVNRFG